jgi:type II secretory pathway pseudopilin PulG
VIGDLPSSAVRRFVPDRVTAMNGVDELRAITSPRKWNLVEVNLTLADMERSSVSVLHLMHPSHTIMDFNIATVLWSAAQAKGRLCLYDGAPLVSPWCRYNMDFAKLAATKLDTNSTTLVPSVAVEKKSKGKGKLIDVVASERRQQRQWAEQERVRAERQAVREAKAASPAGAVTTTTGSTPSLSVVDNTLIDNDDNDDSVVLPSPSPSLAVEEAVDPQSSSTSSPSPSPTTPSSSSALSSSLATIGIVAKSRTEARREMKQSIKNERALLKKEAATTGVAKKSTKTTNETKRVATSTGGNGGDDDEEEADDAADMAALAEVLSLPITNTDSKQIVYTSTARVLLCGIGADEQLGGYGRHRTVFKSRGDAGMSQTSYALCGICSLGWGIGLRAELAKDFTRLWRRNLGTPVLHGN